MRVHMYICMCMHTHTFIPHSVCVCMHTHIHMCTHTTRKHTYVHTHELCHQCNRHFYTRVSLRKLNVLGEIMTAINLKNQIGCIFP